MKFEGPTDGEPERTQRLTNQHERIKSFMLTGGWHTLRWISTITECPEASVSAQLRHLRKPRFGGYTVDKRHVGSGLYEYRVLKPAPTQQEELFK